MAAGLPDLSSLCVPLSTGPGELCVQLPGGATLCATAGFEYGDPLAIVQGMLGQINAALTPLSPFFNTLEFVTAVGDFVKGVPEALLTLNPEPLVTPIVDIGKAVGKLAALVPQMSVPLLIVSILDVVVVGLLGLRSEMMAMMAQQQKLAAAAARASALGNVHLQVIVDCATENLDAQMQNTNASLAPLNRLVGLLNALLELAGLPCLQTMSIGSEIGQAALDAIDFILDALQTAKAAIPPGSLELGAIPGPKDPC
ncbi:MAG: hypothetical protein HOW73_43100 [Polyangiaceae bacterium]|nr:hypothetical protein [Polyangiaceae bacterium]